MRLSTGLGTDRASADGQNQKREQNLTGHPPHISLPAVVLVVNHRIRTYSLQPRPSRGRPVPSCGHPPIPGSDA
jgi:hypothetical protein